MSPQRSATDGKFESEPGRLGPGVLIACVAAVAVGWLAVLPLVGKLPAVRTMIDRNNSLGVDPSAKFYSELPAMPRLVDQVRDARRR
jgi:hypothetical protein